jgi:hypothetical protein
VNCLLGNLIVLTLLVACFDIILMSLALPGTSSISWQCLPREDCLAFLISRWGLPYRCPIVLFVYLY